MRTFSTSLGLALVSCTLVVAAANTSHDGLCGNGVSCSGSMFGGCCSSLGFCGSTVDYCGTGCQLANGYCENTKGKTSPDGTCGGGNEFTCKDSNFGDCCSQYNYCGSSEDYCKTGCQSGFGSCFPSGPPAMHSSRPMDPHYYPNSSEYLQFRPKIPTPAIPSPPAHWDHHGSTLVKSSTNGTATPILSANNSFSVSTMTSTATATFDSTPVPTTSNSVCPKLSVPTHDDCIPCQGQKGSLPYCGADVYTDNYKFTPKTCRTVHYNFDITNTTIAPDGVPRMALLVNGQMPGPTIEVNWGDTVVVTVNNRLQNNGTTMHFHGVRHMNGSEYDGVPSLTQCPIAPGDSMTYMFVASSYGTSWYHSHFAIQTWQGVMGPLIIHGPTSKGWDADARTIMLQDWSHAGVDAMYSGAEDTTTQGGPREMDTGLINGMNTWGVDGTNNQTGQRFELSQRFEPGETYLLRIINVAIQSTYKFHIDGHTMEVINMDFTAIEPYNTTILNINIGQRYMVLVKADQPVGDYWMRSDNQQPCAKTTQYNDIKGIVRYVGSPVKTPTSTPYAYTSECIDEPLASLTPIAPLSAMHQDVNFTYDVVVRPNDENMYRWYLSNNTFISYYNDPTLLKLISGDTSTYADETTDNHLALTLPKLNEWVYVIMESEIPLPHPIHLHGHDFFVLAAGSGPYSNTTLLNLENPPRRDTALLPAAGHLVVAFLTDNPGAWLFHCHVGWHVAMGFALQILEGGVDAVRRSVKDECRLKETCRKWDEWTSGSGYLQFDSGV